MSQDNTMAYVMNQEAMEERGGEETVVRVYKECNPKNIVVPPHSFIRHNENVKRFYGHCPLCTAGSEVVVETEGENEL